MRIPILLLLLTAGSLTAQDGHGLTPAEIQRGGELFLANCAVCHGPDGDAIASVDLASNRFRRARTDSDLIGLIRNGIPGTPMPPGNYSEGQAAIILGYLRSMANSPRSVQNPLNPGDAGRGRAIVEGEGQCLSCHRIAGQGAFSGPLLSEIGATRRATDIERSLLDPNAEIRPDNRTVRAVRKDGSAVAGALLNQDTYT
ncbi:MAG TPA: c-type cytochrome, partial [Bryobacteraceae bacterium]|nr:c-type cytochrome [Bryobacteraceae bacterium]